MIPNILYFDTNDILLSQFKKLFKTKVNIITVSLAEEIKKTLLANRVDILIVKSFLEIDDLFSFIKSDVNYSASIFTILFGKYSSQNEIISILNNKVIDIYVENIWDKGKIIDVVEKAINNIKTHKKSSDFESIQDLQQTLNELEILHKVSQKLSEKRDLPFLFAEILESSKTLLKAEASSLLLFDSAKNKLYFDVVAGDKKKIINKMEINLGEGIAGWVAKNKKSILIEDCYKDSRFNPAFDIKTNFKTKSMICVPMIRHDKLIGVMQVINRKEGLSFDNSDLKIFETLASQCAIAIENANLIEEQIESEKITYELQMAHGIQMNLLPKSLPHFSDIDVASTIIPAKAVGGDYYNIVKLDSEFSLIIIADVSGKGIPAALIVSVIYSSLITQIEQCQTKLNLTKLVETLNKVLIQATTNDRFATAWVGIYEHSTRILRGINAGHNYPYLFRKKENMPTEFKKGGILLGSLELPFECEEIPLQSEDVILFYTDGVTEAWNEKEEEYGEERLIDLIKPCIHLSSDEILEILLTDIHKHVGTAITSDDITCIVMKVK